MWTYETIFMNITSLKGFELILISLQNFIQNIANIILDSCSTHFSDFRDILFAIFGVVKL